MNEPTVDPAETPAADETPIAPPPAAPRRFHRWLHARLSPLMVVLLCAAFFVGGLNAALYLREAPQAPAGDCDAPSADFALLCEAYGRIKDNYVDDIPDRELVEAAVRGMIEYGLHDPYSGYMPPADYHGALDQLSGEFSGIGAEITVAPADEEDATVCTIVNDDCLLTVVAPLDGSPAAEAGLRTGDVITGIDGADPTGKNSNELALLIRGESGTDVTLDLLRDGQELELTITRGRIEISPVRTEMLADHIGYLRLSTFTDEATDQVRDGLQQLLDDGATSLVLDLRGNPGGYITAAQGVASQFIEEGLIFTVDDGEKPVEWNATGDGVLTDPDFPLVVLIDPGSASASEIVTAALSEHDRAVVIGQPSYGKDTVQNWQQLSNNGGLRLTIAHWYTPDHNLVGDSDGIQPDVLVEEMPTGPDNDPALEAAIEELSK